ncbi:hypothetical protein RvY_02672 [Ramazzottius varieornatus]|uniref:Uncharacterized protein n=1 Tax=Ramazzottius varieornatus TaxID=947166 RepID=A0A1D1URD8_RAMVA|nr:hypothetical protein RvY_02672 [Ramazzottius varieornatus]
MPAQSASYRKSERSKTTDTWTSDANSGYSNGTNGGTSAYTVTSPPQSRPGTRYSDRAASAASNVSLKDNVDVYVEDKFVKSYNLNYEPVRIRIGDEEGDVGGGTYQSRPLANTTNFGPDWNRQGSNSAYGSESAGYASMKKSYREHRKTTTTTTDPNYGYSSPAYGISLPSKLAIGAPTNYSSSQSQRSESRNHTNASSSSNNYSGGGNREYNNGVTISASNEPYSSSSAHRSESRAYSNNLAHSRNSTTSSQNHNRQEYNIPIRQQGDRGSTTIPVSHSGGGQSYKENHGRNTSVFSPDSGRGSVEIPPSRYGEPTPLPATPLGRQTSVTFSADSIPNNAGSKSTMANTAQGSPRRQKSVEFQDSPTPSPEPISGIHQFDSGQRTVLRSNDGGRPISAGIGLDGDVTVGGSDRERNRSGRDENSGSNRQSRSREVPDTTYRRSDAPLASRGVSLGSSQQFNIDKDDLPVQPLPRELFIRKSTPPPIRNNPSLTYAVDESGRSTSPSNRNSSRDRSSSRTRIPVNLAERSPSRVGLPSYERDYVDKSDWSDSDLDDLADEVRNERLRQKKLQYPHSRNAALVAELKETTGTYAASKRSRKEQEFFDRLEKKNFSSLLDRFTTEQFMPQVPFYDEEGFAIAEYKRVFLANQAANQAKRDFQARINAGEQIEDIVQSPEWKRLFIDSAKEDYDGKPFPQGGSLKMGQKDQLQINLQKNLDLSKKLQPWQMELKRMDRFND